MNCRITISSEGLDYNYIYECSINDNNVSELMNACSMYVNTFPACTYGLVIIIVEYNGVHYPYRNTSLTNMSIYNHKFLQSCKDAVTFSSVLFRLVCYNSSPRAINACEYLCKLLPNNY